MSKACALGVDIGGTKLAAGIVDVDGQVLASEIAPTRPERGAEGVVARVVELCDALVERVPGRAVVGVGVGTAGQVEPETGRVLAASDRLPADWARMPLGTRLREAMERPVVVLNDGQALAVGELRFGAARRERDALCVAVGTGVGGGLIADGRVVRGAHGVAGLIGHTLAVAGGRRCTCGARGHLEAYISGPRLLAAYRRRTGSAERDLFADARAGDAAAASVLDEAAGYLAAVIGGLLNLVDSGLVILGGGVVDAAPSLVESVREQIGAHTLAVVGSGLRVLPAALGPRAAMVGAATACLESTGALSETSTLGAPRVGGAGSVRPTAGAARSLTG